MELEKLNEQVCKHFGIRFKTKFYDDLNAIHDLEMRMNYDEALSYELYLKQEMVGTLYYIYSMPARLRFKAICRTLKLIEE